MPLIWLRVSFEAVFPCTQAYLFHRSNMLLKQQKPSGMLASGSWGGLRGSGAVPMVSATPRLFLSSPLLRWAPAWSAPSPPRCKAFSSLSLSGWVFNFYPRGICSTSTRHLFQRHRFKRDTAVSSDSLLAQMKGRVSQKPERKDSSARLPFC